MECDILGKKVIGYYEPGNKRYIGKAIYAIRIDTPHELSIMEFGTIQELTQKFNETVTQWTTSIHDTHNETKEGGY